MGSLNNNMKGAEEGILELEGIFCHKEETIKKLEAEQGQTKKKKPTKNKVSKN